jgi:hypothetical protein
MTRIVNLKPISRTTLIATSFNIEKPFEKLTVDQAQKPTTDKYFLKPQRNPQLPWQACQ